MNIGVNVNEYIGTSMATAADTYTITLTLSAPPGTWVGQNWASQRNMWIWEYVNM